MTIELNQTAADLRARIAELDKAAEGLRGTLLGQGFIVEQQGVYLTFDIEDGHAVNPRTAAPQRCTRFTREDAARVAANVSNGNGYNGTVMHVRDAIAESARNSREVLALIEAHIAKQA